MRFYFIVLAITAPLLFSACGYRWEKDSQTGTNGSELQVQQLSSAPSYAVVRSKVLASRCIVCHQASNPQNGGILLEDYASTKTRLADIQRTVFDAKTMPKGMRLSGEEAGILLSWLRAGGPQEAPAGAIEPPAPAPAPSTQPPSKTAPEQFRWARIQAVVFQRNCASCHQYDAEAAREGVDEIIKRVLVKKDMPPQPAVMSAEETEALAQWIRYGMSD